MATNEKPGWKRLTREQAVNHVIASMIVNGLDPGERLCIDGEPGVILEKVVAEHHATATAPAHGEIRKHQQDAIRAVQVVLLLGKDVGYNGGDPRNLVDYLRSLPVEGPIGVK